jgi:TetR/AcrR family transcriptional regulator, regulator of autoinduction and epiphytic fitness
MEAAAARDTRLRDGRSVRAERTRQAVVDALLSLLDEGEVRPTAERVAERAGVSERSIFQHFGDREGLLEAAARRQYERVAPTLVRIDASLPLGERIDAFVEQRARLLEITAGVRRGALLIEHESETVASWLASARKAKAAEVERVFEAELGACSDTQRPLLRAALISASEWTAWESYRSHQALSPQRATAAMRATLAALLS